MPFCFCNRYSNQNVITLYNAHLISIIRTRCASQVRRTIGCLKIKPYESIHVASKNVGQTIDMTTLLTLHRYWMWANRMRVLFDQALADPKRIAEGANDVRKMGLTFFADDPGIFMSYWYAGLYVVIEGWREQGFHDPDIDRLIESPNTDLLRRYRNGSFHFQKEYFDQRFQGFMAEQGTVVWVRELNRTFGRYFLRELNENNSGQQ